MNTKILAIQFMITAFFIAANVDSSWRPPGSPNQLQNTVIKSQANQPVDFVGTIELVDNGKILISLPDTTSILFVVKPQAAITLDGEKASFSKIKAGQRVEITAEVNEDLYQATQVDAASN